MARLHPVLPRKPEPERNHLPDRTHMNYLERDTYGIYKSAQHGNPPLGTDHGPGPGLMGAYTLIGNDVYNPAGDDLGDVKEILLNMHTGRIAYAVLSFGGFLGMGDKLFAVPWEALTLDTSNKRFTLNVPKGKLENAPGFDKDQWPDMADSRWAMGLHTYYGTTPYSDGLNH